MPNMTQIRNDLHGPRRTYLGRKWTAGVSTRYFSGNFDFETFKEALDYVQEQRAKYPAEHEKNTPFKGWIRGPGGMVDITHFFPDWVWWKNWFNNDQGWV